MKYINFIVGAVGWIQYFMPIAISANEKGYKSIFFMRKNRKIYADPYSPKHLKEIKDIADEYVILIKDIKEIINFPGLTFLMEGDITGQQPIDYETAGMHNLQPYHLKVSINFNADFIWSYHKYIDKMDYVILPNEIYAKTYQTLSTKNRYLGSPKFDIELGSKEEIYKKYGLDSNNKHVLFFYPKKKWWEQSKILNNNKARFFELFTYLKKIGFKIIVKTREKDRLIQKLGDYYFEDLKLYPNSSVELLKIADLSIFFSSTTIEECVLYGCPFIDFKVDPELDRYNFLNNDIYSKIIENFQIDFNSFSKIIKGFLINKEKIQKTFKDVCEKYLFETKGLSERILNQFLEEGHQKYKQAITLHKKLIELKKLQNNK